MSNNKNNSSKLKQMKEVPGVMTCLLEHEVTKTTGKFTWEGPTLNDIWPQILAFFKWTYDDHRSESQVRLYVNAHSHLWGAYAHPQEAKTGMSARTLNITETEEETIARCTLMGDPNPANWMYFGTVHHHCGLTAFQSGTDELDEKNTDGLHMTVGKMDEKKHDLHARLYVSGNKFNPDLSWFWDLEEALEAVPKSMRRFMRDNIEHELALEQMCRPAHKDQTFPEEWRNNVIEVKRETTVYQGGLGFGSGYVGSGNKYAGGTYSFKKPWNRHSDIVIAANELEEFWEEGKLESSPLAFLIAIKDGSPELCELMENLYRNDASLEAVIGELQRMEELGISEAEIEAAEREDAERQLAAANGLPPKQLAENNGPTQEQLDQQATDYASGWGQ